MSAGPIAARLPRPPDVLPAKPSSKAGGQVQGSAP
jgi:hypothetical protein